MTRRKRSFRSSAGPALQSFGARLLGAIRGVLFGIILFSAAVYGLIWNENRIDSYSRVKGSVAVDPKQLDPALVGTLVSVSGPLALGDAQGVKDSPRIGGASYVAIHRRVEMFSWKEKNGHYVKEWAEKPADSSTFADPESHLNPLQTVDSRTLLANDARLGVYRFDPREAEVTFSGETALDSESIAEAGEGALVGGALYLPHSPDKAKSRVLPSFPEIGDLKIHYSFLKSGDTATVVGRLGLDGKLAPQIDEEGNTFFRVFSGTRAQAMASLRANHLLALWSGRALGFLMMWFAISWIFAPFSLMVDWVPVLGAVLRGLGGFAGFSLTVSAWGGTLGAAWLLQKPWGWAVLASACAVGLIFFLLIVRTMLRAEPHRTAQVRALEQVPASTDQRVS